MKTAVLGEVLPDKAIEELRLYINDMVSRWHYDVLDSRVVAGTKRILRKYRAELDKHGILPDYLAYALLYKLSQDTMFNFLNEWTKE